MSAVGSALVLAPSLPTTSLREDRAGSRAVTKEVWGGAYGMGTQVCHAGLCRMHTTQLKEQYFHCGCRRRMSML